MERIRSSDDPRAACASAPPFESVKMQVSRNASDPEGEVTVDCRPSLEPSGDGGSLLVLGDGYGGAQAFDALPEPGSSSVLHQGAGPVRFVGDVGVRQGSLLDGTVLGARVSGTYQQGASPCDALRDPSAPAGQLIDADDGAPTCGVDMPDPAAFPLYTGDPPAEGTVPVCAGASATVTAGYFGPSEVAALNTLLAGCDRVVFEPAAEGAADPAVFWFDAGADGVVEFARAGAAYVFGEAAAGSSPPVCDPDSTRQLTVVLGGGTGIAHTDGTLTMCGGDGQGPTLTQAEDAAIQPRLGYVSASPLNLWSSPEKANADQNPKEPGVPAPAATVTYCSTSLIPFCPSGNRSLTYTIDSLGVGSIDTLAVQLRSREIPATLTGQRDIQIDITPAGGSTCSVVGTGTRGRVADGMGLHYDVSACAGAATPGATLQLGLASAPNPYSNWSATISDVRLVANEQVVEATGASSGSRWTDAGNVLEDDDALASAETCSVAGGPICDRTTAESRGDAELDVDFTGASDLPDVGLTRLLVAMDARPREDVVAYNTAVVPDQRPGTAVFLDWGDDEGMTKCTEVGTYSHSVRTQFLDLSDCVGGRSAADLAKLKVKLVFSPEEKAFLGSTLVDQGVQIPEFDWIRLNYTTEAVTARPDVSVEVDEADGRSFRVRGDTRLPSADLDVRWTGTAGSQPLFDGGLVISSVGSLGGGDAQVGVVCCGPEYPSIVLTAEIEADEPPRGRASIRLEGADGSVEAVITDWQLCDSSGCEAEVVSPGPSP